MARPVYTKPIKPAYKGPLSDIRQFLDRVYDRFVEGPQIKPDVAKTLQEFSVQSGLTVTSLPATSAVVANAGSVPLGDATAVVGGQDNGVAAVAAGAVTRVTLPGTDKILKSGVKYTAPAITGSYVNGYTFTIVAGVITAIVAS